MDDLISRQDAIDAFKKHFNKGFDEDAWWNSTHVLNVIEKLPSAEPERKTGRWIPQDYNKVLGDTTTCLYYYPVCSKCGHTGDFNMNYCPSCGARMMEVEHERTD